MLSRGKILKFLIIIRREIHGELMILNLVVILHVIIIIILEEIVVVLGIFFEVVFWLYEHVNVAVFEFLGAPLEF
jgi:hypothetical protein